MSNADFVSNMKSICNKNNLQVGDVKKALGALYCNLSEKEVRRVDGEIAIFEEDWSKAERTCHNDIIQLL